jgi:hypothetical protein
LKARASFALSCLLPPRAWSVLRSVRAAQIEWRAEAFGLIAIAERDPFQRSKGDQMRGMPSSLFVAAMLLGTSGCVVYPVHKEKIVALPVDLPMGMCAEQGALTVSAGNPVERMRG